MAEENVEIIEDDPIEVRRAKREALIAAGVDPYGHSVKRSHSVGELNEKYAHLEDGESTEDAVLIAGRVMAKRVQGKIAFLELRESGCDIQLFCRINALGEEAFAALCDLDVGDWIAVHGTMMRTKRGQLSVAVDSFQLLSKSLRPLPEKFHSIQDTELCWRRRYLDLCMNGETRRRFLFKSQLVREIRRYLEDNGYIEIETPVLIDHPSGATARPFVAHHNALDMDVYLRIAPETYLKRAIVGGFTKVFEFARCFRNEGMDTTHLQDFTMLEGYCAYYNYRDNMRFLQDMLQTVITKIRGSAVISINGTEIDFGAEWAVVTFRELILKDCGIDIDEFKTAEALLQEIESRHIELNSTDDPKKLGRGNLIDLLYKKVSRPKMIAPTFLIAHPTDLSPLARANDDDPEITDRFQLVINGAEIINAYSELVDPNEQRRRLQIQAQSHADGDEEAMVMDDDYLTAMEYGMPPISGWGMGIDRVLQVLLGTRNIRDTVMFPLMRPEP